MKIYSLILTFVLFSSLSFASHVPASSYDSLPQAQVNCVCSRYMPAEDGNVNNIKSVTEIKSTLRMALSNEAINLIKTKKISSTPSIEEVASWNQRFGYDFFVSPFQSSLSAGEPYLTKELFYSNEECRNNEKGVSSYFNCRIMMVFPNIK